MPEYRKFKTEENEKIINIAERIFYFNQLGQSGKGLKILTPNQMLSRLPISLAQLKVGNNSERLKNEISSFYILFTVQKIWVNKYTII